MNFIDKNVLRASIEKRVCRDIEEERIFGTSVLVKQEGEVLYKDFFGTTSPLNNEPMAVDTLFRIASMTKPITAAAIMILEDRKKLSVDDEVRKYFPEFSAMGIAEFDKNKRLNITKKAEKELTIFHLLTHTSGLGSGEVGGRQESMMSPEDKASIFDTINFYKNQGLAFEPFTKEDYSPIAAYDLLAGIVEKVGDMSFSDFLSENIIKPCNMKDTTFTPSKEQIKRMIVMHDYEDGKSIIGRTTDGCVFEDYPATHCLGGAGLVSSINDYANFAQIFLDKGQFLGQQIVSEESINKMLEPIVPMDIQPGSIRWGFGGRVVVGKENTLPAGSYGWSGKYGTHFWVDPTNKIVALYMKNSRYDGGSGALTSKNFEKDVYSSLKK